MTRFIPRDKLSKKSRRQLDSQQRKTWDICPMTRTVENKKKYSRKRQTREFHDAIMETRDCFL